MFEICINNGIKRFYQLVRRMSEPSTVAPTFKGNGEEDPLRFGIRPMFHGICDMLNLVSKSVNSGASQFFGGDFRH